jgi:Calcineurin-like phosphoesterase
MWSEIAAIVVEMAAQFQILSDLHLETPAAYDVYDFPPRAPYLALLGDIGDSRGTGLVDFLSKQLKKFKIVFFLLGNHEPYHSSWTSVKATINAFAKAAAQRKKNGENLGQFVFLDQTRYDVSENVTGCTLYSNIFDDQLEYVSFGLNDFYNIESWDVHLHRQAHLRDLEWLNEQVRSISQAEPGRKIVIFSHHSPSFSGQATNPKYEKSLFTSGFATDLSAEECWVNPSVKLWAFGHTHFNCDYKDEKTGKRVKTNQRGYCFCQAVGFDAEKVVTV